MTPEFIGALVARPYEQPQFRNIVSLRRSENLFDDLADDPADQRVAMQFELAHKPASYRSGQPIIDRPFEEAAWTDAIGFPFRHLCESRYSSGAFGVWYGAETLETTIHETVHHWRRRLLEDAGFLGPGVVIQRSVHTVRLSGLLVDLRPLLAEYPDLVDPSSYAFTQAAGAYFFEKNYPGLISRSARCDGTVSALFSPAPLSDPRPHCYLTYRTTERGVAVEREEGVVLLEIP
jgi:hypothetical protein